MTQEKETELQKRVEDIRAIRAILMENEDRPLLHPWAFVAWGMLVVVGTIVHYALYAAMKIPAKAALIRIWLPLLILGAALETISFAVRANKNAVPLFNRRFGTALLGGLASIIVLSVVFIHLAVVGLTPGIAILLCSFVLVFYTYVCYSSLLIEVFIGIAVGLLFEFAGEHGPGPFLAAGIFVGVLFSACGIHAGVIERRRGA